MASPSDPGKPTGGEGLRPLILTGMHRSGTSFAASVLESVGVSMGDRQMAPALDNPAGFFEDLDFVDFHRQVLAEHGLHPDGWDGVLGEAHLRDLVERARALVSSRLSGARWGFKDPRATLFLPVWKAVFPEARFVFVFRAPWEVLDSLFRRQDPAVLERPERALHAWRVYNRKLIAFLDEEPSRSLLFDSETILGDPSRFVRSVGHKFGIALSHPDPQLVRPELYRREGGGVARRAAFERLCGAEMELLEALTARAHSGATPAPRPADPTTAFLAEWAAARRDRGEERDGAPTIPRDRREVVALQESLGLFQRRLREAQSDRRALEAELESTTHERQRALESLAQARAEIEGALAASREARAETEAWKDRCTAAIDSAERRSAEAAILKRRLGEAEEAILSAKQDAARSAAETQTWKARAQDRAARVAALSRRIEEADRHWIREALRQGAAGVSRRLALRWGTVRRCVRRSHLFDEKFYVETYPDVGLAAVDPLSHFIQHGASERRLPHPLFDTPFYLAFDPSVATSGQNPLVHYLKVGAARGLDPSPWFDSSYYLETNPDVRRTGVNPLVHFVRFGATEGRDPSPWFDSSYYLETNPDVAQAGINPLIHFIRTGAAAGRNPHPWFHTSFYLTNNPDVATSGVNPLLHFVGTGFREGRDPHPLFRTSYYLETNPDLAASGINPWLHFIRWGEAEGRSPSPEVPCGQGLLQVRDVSACAGASPGWSSSGTDVERSLLDFDELSRRLAEVERDRRQALSLAHPHLTSIGPDELQAAARALAFPTVVQPDASIVIPVHNQIRFTLECLTSLAVADEGPSFEVVVFDNGSDDETATLLRGVPGLRYLRSEENLGFGPACNAAARTARGGHLVFLNNDVQVRPGWLGSLRRVFDEQPGIGAVGPKVLCPDGRLQEAGVALNADCSSTLVGLYDDPSLPRYSYGREVDYSSGVCLMIEAARFRELDGFDAAFAPAYCEDVDLCLRLRRRGLRIWYQPDAVVVHHLSVTAGKASPRFKLEQVTRNQQLLSERHQDVVDELNRIRLVAFYLPQFHPIPENDRWWGAGFTEWRNVALARPNFVGHDQPRLPADLGFYDLRLRETVRQQAALARRYGVYGFCYYYYWFGGRRLLERPLEALLEEEPHLPFCLAWANENWTRTWDGQEHQVLMAQRHSSGDDEAVIRDIVRYMRRPEYIRVGGRPLLLVYRVTELPEPHRTVALWRDVCRAEGLGDVYLAMVESFGLGRMGQARPEDFGFDAAVEFPPHEAQVPETFPTQVTNPAFRGRVFDFKKLVLSYAPRTPAGHVRFRTVAPAWDNTPRRQDDGVAFAASSPGAYRAWLEYVLRDTKEQNFGDERLVFINAWNEWAEGAYLEPDLRHGHAYLEATRDALLRVHQAMP